MYITNDFLTAEPTVALPPTCEFYAYKVATSPLHYSCKTMKDLADTWRFGREWESDDNEFTYLMPQPSVYDHLHQVGSPEEVLAYSVIAPDSVIQWNTDKDVTPMVIWQEIMRFQLWTDNDTDLSTDVTNRVFDVYDVNTFFELMSIRDRAAFWKKLTRVENVLLNYEIKQAEQERAEAAEPLPPKKKKQRREAQPTQESKDNSDDDKKPAAVPTAAVGIGFEKGRCSLGPLCRCPEGEFRPTYKCKRAPSLLTLTTVRPTKPRESHLQLLQL